MVQNRMPEHDRLDGRGHQIEGDRDWGREGGSTGEERSEVGPPSRGSHAQLHGSLLRPPQTRLKAVGVALPPVEGGDSLRNSLSTGSSRAHALSPVALGATRVVRVASEKWFQGDTRSVVDGSLGVSQGPP